MNPKYLSIVIVALLAFGLVQLLLWVRGNKDTLAKQAEEKQTEMNLATTRLNVERAQLANLQNESKGLIRFLETWEPYFEALSTTQSAEVGFTMRVKQGNLVSLSQRFEESPVKGNKFLPKSLRTYVTFEDDYSALLNWLGRLEQEMPTVRVGNLRLTRGTRPSDLRMEVMLEQPLMGR